MKKILIIDDNPTIHEDIRKILCPEKSDTQFSKLASTFFDAPSENENKAAVEFHIDSALQGQEGLAKVEKALAEKAPNITAQGKP